MRSAKACWLNGIGKRKAHFRGDPPSAITKGKTRNNFDLFDGANVNGIGSKNENSFFSDAILSRRERRALTETNGKPCP